MTTQSAPIRQDAAHVSSAEHVVVGYDGSPDAVDALTWAAGEARQRGARLTVLSAAEVYTAWQVVPPIVDELEDAQRRLAQEGVDRVATGDGEPAVDAGVVLSDPATALVAASAHADLVVIGNRGRGRVTGGLLGSVAFSVTTRATCPVVVVRGDPARRPGPDRAVVVGVQGPHGADAALTFAAQAADRADAPLVVLAAWTAPQLGGEGWSGDAYAQMVEWARRSAEIDADVALGVVRASHPHLTASVRVLEAPAGSALADASDAAGLVVVGARGRGAAASLFLGSVSHATVHAARCPVAVVRGGDPAQQAG